MMKEYDKKLLKALVGIKWMSFWGAGTLYIILSISTIKTELWAMLVSVQVVYGVTFYFMRSEKKELDLIFNKK